MVDFDPCFLELPPNALEYSLPERFTYPFFYDPHPIAQLACEHMQHLFPDGEKWERAVGNSYEDAAGLDLGKMFGVLIVQQNDGKVGYLAAFSGKLDDPRFNMPFVPPIYNLWDENGFYKKGESELNHMNAHILALETHPNRSELQRTIVQKKAERQQEIDAFKQVIRTNKQERSIQRARVEQDTSLDATSKEKQLKSINQLSINEQYHLKQLQSKWRDAIQLAEAEKEAYETKIEALKLERKTKSHGLQQQLFEQYKVLNANGEWKNVLEIFQPTIHETPPSGAGDCAAPKLVQYAYLHGYKPLALAEFWWGQSPQSEVRKHKHYYPACRGKCEPILGHMLQGLSLDPNPLLEQAGGHLSIEVIYEDDAIIVVNKPAELLSVPGISIYDSVYTRVLERNPEITGPVVVHRLDMVTSGVLLLAKHKQAHAHVQRQFFKRAVKKTYVALLDGIVENDFGRIDLPLRVDLEDRPRQLVCYEHGKPAQTRYEVIERSEKHTRIHFFPESGRTHQLRVHASHKLGLNTPIVGDDLYGIKADRLHLHAAVLEIKHPSDGRTIRFEAPVPF